MCNIVAPRKTRKPPIIPTDITRLSLWFLNPRYKANELIGIIKNNSIKNWIKISDTKTGKIFNMSDKSVALTIKKYAANAGLDSKKYSGHSLRSGFATSAAESGAEERSIMAMTGHKSTEMVRRYIKEANLFKNNALNKIKI